MKTFWKQFLFHFLIILFVLFVFSLLIIHEVENHHIDTVEASLRQEALLVRENLGNLLENNKTQDIEPITRELGTQSGVRITVVREDGVVLGDSEEDPQRMENHGNRPEILGALSKGFGKSIRYSTTVKTDMFYVAIPIKGESGNILGVVRTSLPLSSLTEAISSVKSKIVYAGVLLTLFALVLSFISSKRLSRALDKIVSVSEEVAKGNFDVRVPTEEKGELGKLAYSLNYMAGRIKGLFEEVSQDKSRLEAVLSAMSEGVVALGKDGRVILINRAMKETFKIQGDLLGKPYWEILRNRAYRRYL